MSCMCVLRVQLLLPLLLMLVYVTIRFEFKLAMGAVLSLFHDIVVTIGILP